MGTTVLTDIFFSHTRVCTESLVLKLGFSRSFTQKIMDTDIGNLLSQGQNFSHGYMRLDIDTISRKIHNFWQLPPMQVYHAVVSLKYLTRVSIVISASGLLEVVL